MHGIDPHLAHPALSLFSRLTTPIPHAPAVQESTSRNTLCALPLTADLLREMREELPDSVPLHNAGSDAHGRVPPPALQRLEVYLLDKVAQPPTAAELNLKVNGALTLQEAAATVRDQVRTKRFLQAIERAVHELEGRFPEGEISVTDAGTGPLPILAIAAALASPRVHVSALEMNPHSAATARRVLDAVGLAERITVIETDATRYTPPSTIHLLISETMDTGLLKEPIVQIFSNLAPHVHPQGMRIPEAVTVHALLFPEESPTERASLPRYCIRETIHTMHGYDWSCADMDFRWDTSAPLTQISLSINPERVLDPVAQAPTEGFYFVTATTVHLFDDIKLSPGSLKDRRAPDSLITMPMRATVFGSDGGRDAWFITPKEVEHLLQKAKSEGKSPAVVTAYKPGAMVTESVFTRPPTRLGYV